MGDVAGDRINCYRKLQAQRSGFQLGQKDWSERCKAMEGNAEARRRDKEGFFFFLLKRRTFISGLMSPDGVASILFKYFS